MNEQEQPRTFTEWQSRLTVHRIAVRPATGDEAAMFVVDTDRQKPPMQMRVRVDTVGGVALVEFEHTPQMVCRWMLHVSGHVHITAWSRIASPDPHLSVMATVHAYEIDTVAGISTEVGATGTVTGRGHDNDDDVFLSTIVTADPWPEVTPPPPQIVF